MPKKRDEPKPLPEGRYSYVDATREIERRLTEVGRGAHKQAAAAALLTPSEFTKRMQATDEEGEKFRIAHFGAIADWAEAPPGWPFVPWEQGEALQDALARVLGRRGSK